MQQNGTEQEATRLYNAFSSLSMTERKDFYRSLTSEAKSGLWRTHLKSYLSNHPNLTEKQKEVIQSAITLLTPQLFETTEGSPDFEAKVHEALERLKQQFLAVFPREVVRELLEILGGPEPRNQHLQ